MSVSQKAQHIVENFDAASSKEILETLEMIKSNMRSNLTRQYLTGKIDAVNKAQSEEEKKSLCKNLKPYLDWQIQGD